MKNVHHVGREPTAKTLEMIDLLIDRAIKKGTKTFTMASAGSSSTNELEVLQETEAINELIEIVRVRIKERGYSTKVVPTAHGLQFQLIIG